MITVDASLHPEGSNLKLLYRGDWTEAELADPPQNETAVVQYQDGRASIRIDLPPAGMAILA